MMRVLFAALVLAASLAGSLAIYALAFAPNGATDSPRIASLEYNIALLRTEVGSLRTDLVQERQRADDLSYRLKTDAIIYDSEIECLQAFVANTHITWGGGLPTGDYFLVVDSKPRYMNGTC